MPAIAVGVGVAFSLYAVVAVGRTEVAVGLGPTTAVGVDVTFSLYAVVAVGRTEVVVGLGPTTAVGADVAFSSHPVVTSSIVSKMNSAKVLSFIVFLLFQEMTTIVPLLI